MAATTAHGGRLTGLQHGMGTIQLGRMVEFMAPGLRKLVELELATSRLPMGATRTELFGIRGSSSFPTCCCTRALGTFDPYSTSSRTHFRAN